MEVPVLKNWIHSFMMDMFTSCTWVTIVTVHMQYSCPSLMNAWTMTCIQPSIFLPPLHSTTVLVDPGRLTINLTSSGPSDEVTASSEPMQLACGVLTVTVHSSPPDNRLEQRNKKYGKSLEILATWNTLAKNKQNYGTCMCNALSIMVPIFSRKGAYDIKKLIYT